MAASSRSPRVRDHAAHGHGPDEPCTWHKPDGKLAYPARAKGWIERRRTAHARR